MVTPRTQFDSVCNLLNFRVMCPFVVELTMPTSWPKDVSFHVNYSVALTTLHRSMF